MTGFDFKIGSISVSRSQIVSGSRVYPTRHITSVKRNEEPMKWIAVILLVSATAAIGQTTNAATRPISSTQPSKMDVAALRAERIALLQKTVADLESRIAKSEADIKDVLPKIGEAEKTLETWNSSSDHINPLDRSPTQWDINFNRTERDRVARHQAPLLADLAKLKRRWNGDKISIAADTNRIHSAKLAINLESIALATTRPTTAPTK